MERRPEIFLRILIPFGTGIWIAPNLHFTKLYLLIAISVIFVYILLLIFNILYTSLKVYHHKRIIGFLIYMLFLCLGILAEIREYEFTDPHHFAQQRNTYLKIYIDDEPRSYAKTIRFKARVTKGYYGSKSAAAIGGILVTVSRKHSLPTKLSYGQFYLIPAQYKPVPHPANPAEFDYRDWLAKKNIYHQVFLSEKEMIPLKEQGGSPLIGFALSIRKEQVALFRQLIKNDTAFAVASTLILGDRAELDGTTLSAYSKTGTIHALSVSGMHVGILYLILDLISRRMNRHALGKGIKIVIILLFIWFYTLLCGYSAAALRAAIMISLFILAKSIQKNQSNYQILAFTAFCLLCYQPFLLWDIGFQLSFMAVFGLFYLQPKIYELLNFRYSCTQQVWNLISISIAAQTFTFPFSVYYFHQFPVYFLLSNLFISIPVALLMYMGMAILLLRLYFLAVPFEWLITLMNNGLKKIAVLPYATIDQIWISKTELFLLSLFTFFLIKGLHDKNKSYVFAALTAAILLQALLLKDKLHTRKQKEIIRFLVRGHYAVAFIHREKAYLLTDLQQHDAAYKRYIQPALDQRRINNVAHIPWNSSFHSSDFKLKNHQVHFLQFHILKADSLFNSLWIHEHLKIKHNELEKPGTSTIVFTKIKASLINLNQYKPTNK